MDPLRSMLTFGLCPLYNNYEYETHYYKSRGTEIFFDTRELRTIDENQNYNNKSKWLLDQSQYGYNVLQHNCTHLGKIIMVVQLFYLFAFFRKKKVNKYNASSTKVLSALVP